MALKEIIEVVGLPLAAMVVARANSRGDDEVMLIRSGEIPRALIAWSNQRLAETRAMAAAGRWN